MNEYVEALRSIAIMLDIETDDLLKLEELVERATPKECIPKQNPEEWYAQVTDCPVCGNETFIFNKNPLFNDDLGATFCCFCGQKLKLKKGVK